VFGFSCIIPLNFKEHHLIELVYLFDCVIKMVSFKYAGSSFQLRIKIIKVNKEKNMLLGDTSIDSFLSLGKIKAHEHTCTIKASGRGTAQPQIMLYLVCDCSCFFFLGLELWVS